MAADRDLTLTVEARNALQKWIPRGHAPVGVQLSVKSVMANHACTFERTGAFAQALV